MTLLESNYSDSGSAFIRDTIQNTVKPEVSVTTQEFYLYIVDESGTEIETVAEVDGNIVYKFLPTEDMNNVSIKVSSKVAKPFEVTWVENVGDNKIEKVNTRVENLFDGTNIVELSIHDGKFITCASGYEGTVADDSFSCATSFIPVRPNDKIRLDKESLVN